MTTIEIMMQNVIQMEKLFNINMSIYIPHVFTNITKEHIIYVFETLRIGKINHIDFVSKMTTNNTYNAAYIHFDYWYNNITNVNLQEKIRNPEKEARIVYDDPWFWLILENKGSKNITGERKKCLDLSFISSKEDVINPNPFELTSKDQQNMEEINHYLEYSEFEREQELMEDDVYENPSFNYVDSSYAYMLEKQIYDLRNELSYIKHNYNII